MWYLIRWCGDFLHLTTIVTLLIVILYKRSCLGFSGKCQILYAVVYTARYLDLLFVYVSTYNTVMKIVFITISYLTVFATFILFRGSYKREYDTCRIEWLLFGCLLLAVFINHDFTVTEVLWTFSIYLEAVALIPQYIMMKSLTETEKKFSLCFIWCMGLYRFLYILNWQCRYQMEGHYDLIAICGGVVQTCLLIVFAIYSMCHGHRDALRRTGKNKMKNLIDALSKNENGGIFYAQSNNYTSDSEKQDLTEKLVKNEENTVPTTGQESTLPSKSESMRQETKMQDKLRDKLTDYLDAKVHTYYSQLN